MEAGRVVPGVLQSWGITSWGAWDSLGVTRAAGRLKKPSLGHFGLFLAVEALGSPLGVATRTWWMDLEARGSGIPALQLLCKPLDGVPGGQGSPRGDTDSPKVAKPSTADILAAARKKKADAPTDEDATPEKPSTADILAAARKTTQQKTEGAETASKESG